MGDINLALRTKLKDRVLPTYTKGEEIFNMVSHILGSVLGIVAIVLCSVVAALHHNPYGVVSGVIYGISLVLLYTMSSVYHGLSKNLFAKRVFQVLDHCTIFVLIAGCYTPFALCTLREYSVAWGWTIFGVIWLMAIIGIVLNSIDLKKFKIFSMICYLAMGWCIVLKINVLPKLLGTAGFTLLAVGGVIYTIGAVLYALGKKHKWVHSLFHLCVFAASLVHFLCIVLYVM
jgi:hemolysin III